MSGLILAAVIGFLLGVLLMIFLITGREEEDLLDRVEKTGLSGVRLGRASDSETEPVSKRELPPDDA